MAIVSSERSDRFGSQADDFRRAGTLTDHAAG
jgi:hypothetical protein